MFKIHFSKTWLKGIHTILHAIRCAWRWTNDQFQLQEDHLIKIDRSFLRQAMDKPRVLCYSSISLSQHQNHLGRIDLRPKAACCEISEIRFCAAVNPHWVLSKRLAWISATLKSVWYSLEIFRSSAHQNYHWNHWMRKKANLIFESDYAS